MDKAQIVEQKISNKADRDMYIISQCTSSAFWQEITHLSISKDVTADSDSFDPIRHSSEPRNYDLIGNLLSNHSAINSPPSSGFSYAHQ